MYKSVEIDITMNRILTLITRTVTCRHQQKSHQGHDTNHNKQNLVNKRRILTMHISCQEQAIDTFTYKGQQINDWTFLAFALWDTLYAQVKAALQSSSECPTFGVETLDNMIGYKEYCSDNKRSHIGTADHHRVQWNFATPCVEHKGP